VFEPREGGVYGCSEQWGEGEMYEERVAICPFVSETRPFISFSPPHLYPLIIKNGKRNIGFI